MTKTKTHWKKIFNTDYLGSHSLPDGKDIVLTIKTVLERKIKGNNGREEIRPVATFHEKVKPMILNRTNCKAIRALYKTPYIEDWSGKRIQVFIDERIEAFGAIVDGLRIRPYIPKEQTAEAKELEAVRAKIKKVFAGYKDNDRDLILKDIRKHHNNAAELKKILNKLQPAKNEA